MLTFEPSGCARGETEPSGFRMTEPERLSEPEAVVSTTLTVMLAAGFDEVAKTGREAPAPPLIARSRIVCAGPAWRNEAWPPGGWLAIEMRNVRTSFVR